MESVIEMRKRLASYQEFESLATELKELDADFKSRCKKIPKKIIIVNLQQRTRKICELRIEINSSLVNTCSQSHARL